jgi:hypothetical protein
MALYAMDYIGQQQPQQQRDLQPRPANTQPAFYHVDEYKDLSLRELMDIWTLDTDFSINTRLVFR